jgi:hypothetical protein
MQPPNPKPAPQTTPKTNITTSKYSSHKRDSQRPRGRVGVLNIGRSNYHLRPRKPAQVPKCLTEDSQRDGLLTGLLAPATGIVATMDIMEGGGLGDMFGDPEDLQRRLGEFAEQMQGQQRLAWADNAIKLAVDMTVAAVNRINLQGDAAAQAEQVRTVMGLVFPEAVTLVREAREGLQ